MNTPKELLISLCQGLQERSKLRSDNKTPYTVEFFSGLKPKGYWLPQMHMGTTATVTDIVDQEWYVEIFVNKKCIFRECGIPSKSEDLRDVEESLVNRVIFNIFAHGVMTAKKNIDDRDNAKKVLDKEDIESLGWLDIGKQCFNPSQNVTVFQIDNGTALYFLDFWPDKNNTVVIHNSKSYEYFLCFFDGKIQNKSELKKIMQMVGII